MQNSTSETYQDDDLIEQQKDYEESKFTLDVQIDEAKVPQNGHVVVCNPGATQALFRILYDDSIAEIGKIEAECKEKKTEAISIKVAGNLVLLFVSGVMKSHFCGRIIDKLFPIFKSKGCTFVGLGTVYKTNYSTSDGHISIDAELPLPLRFIHSTVTSPAIQSFASSKGAFSGHILADNAFNGSGGLNAGFLVECEMNGCSAIIVKAIVDQHFITTETLQAFAPVVSDILGIKDKDLSKIVGFKQFKPVLKELNAKKNGIFN